MTSILCKICGKQYKTIGGLQSHAAHTHKLRSKEYFDAYLKSESDGICQACGKPTKFDN